MFGSCGSSTQQQQQQLEAQPTQEQQQLLRPSTSLEAASQAMEDILAPGLDALEAAAAPTPVGASAAGGDGKASVAAAQRAALLGSSAGSWGIRLAINRKRVVRHVRMLAARAHLPLPKAPVSRRAGAQGRMPPTGGWHAWAGGPFKVVGTCVHVCVCWGGRRGALCLLPGHACIHARSYATQMSVGTRLPVPEASPQPDRFISTSCTWCAACAATGVGLPLLRRSVLHHGGRGTGAAGAGDGAREWCVHGPALLAG